MKLSPESDRLPAEVVEHFLDGKRLVLQGPLEGADLAAYLAIRRRHWIGRNVAVIGLPVCLALLIAAYVVAVRLEPAVSVAFYILLVLSSFATAWHAEVFPLSREPGDLRVYDVETTNEHDEVVVAQVVLPDGWLLRQDGERDIRPYGTILTVVYPPEAAYGLSSGAERDLTQAECEELRRRLKPSSLGVGCSVSIALGGMLGIIAFLLSDETGVAFLGLVTLVYIAMFGGLGWIPFLKYTRRIRRTLRNPRVRCERSKDGWNELLIATGEVWTIEGQPADWRKTDGDPAT